MAGRRALLGALAASACADDPSAQPVRAQRAPPSRARPRSLLLTDVPPLAAHETPSGLTQLVLRWDTMPPPRGKMDAAVHLHGYDPLGPAMPLEARKFRGSGVDEPPPRSAARPRPVLGLLPRGRATGGAAFDFPALTQPGGLDALVEYGLAQAAAAAGQPVPARGRLILTAHSGGGAGVLGALRAGADPDEIHLFDALYRDPAPLIGWASRRLRGPEAGGGGLCVLFLPGTGTARGSLAVAEALARLLPPGSPLARRWRVLATSEPHGTVAVAYGARLLADPEADLPGTVPA